MYLYIYIYMYILLLKASCGGLPRCTWHAWRFWHRRRCGLSRNHRWMPTGAMATATRQDILAILPRAGVVCRRPPAQLRVSLPWHQGMHLSQGPWHAQMKVAQGFKGTEFICHVDILAIKFRAHGVHTTFITHQQGLL